MFFREVSHYTTNRSSKDFLSLGLNTNRLQRAFKEKLSDTRVIYRYYSQVFKKTLPKLNFKQPRTDICSTCELLTTQIEANPENKQDCCNRPNVTIVKRKVFSTTG